MIDGFVKSNPAYKHADVLHGVSYINFVMYCASVPGFDDDDGDGAGLTGGTMGTGGAGRRFNGKTGFSNFSEFLGFFGG